MRKQRLKLGRDTVVQRFVVGFFEELHRVRELLR